MNPKLKHQKKYKKKIKIESDETTINKLLCRLNEYSIVTYEINKDPETKEEDKFWKFDEKIFNEKLEEFQNLNEIINNPIPTHFLEENVDETDLEYVKSIIMTLVDGVDTDEAIHEITGIKLNTVRKLLYKLHDASIATYKRNKDPETQWFTYTWKFDKEEYIKKISEFYNKELNEKEELLNNLENNLYFVCCMDQEHFKGDYTESSEYEFYCPVCDYELEPYDAKNEKSSLKRNITTGKRNFKKFEDAINNQ